MVYGFVSVFEVFFIYFHHFREILNQSKFTQLGFIFILEEKLFTQKNVYFTKQNYFKPKVKKSQNFVALDKC
jgi:hypothetical protein